ncbi:MAG: hypothetical protein AB8G99_19420 [Planctomycetaceae bacterium]
MKLASKKMTFQLTPLLDLLLIVIFAQFMEVRDTSSKSEAVLEKRAAEVRQQLLSQAEELRKRMDASYASKMNKLDEQQQSLLAQHDQAGEILSEIFNVPESTVNKLLRIDPAQGSYTARQKQDLKQTLRNMQKSNGPELLKMLISYGEMQKRCDIWEVYVAEDGSLEFTNAEQVRTIRARTQAEIEGELFDAYKSFTEPKTLVIILFSYGDASAGARQRTEDALPGALARMREDSGGRHWFEFAILGFTPDGPSLKTGNR